MTEQCGRIGAMSLKSLKYWPHRFWWRLTYWLDDFRELMAFSKKRTGIGIGRFFLTSLLKYCWASVLIRLGMTVTFSQAAVRLADELDESDDEKEDEEADADLEQIAARVDAFRKAGDGEGVRLCRDALVYRAVMFDASTHDMAIEKRGLGKRLAKRAERIRVVS